MHLINMLYFTFGLVNLYLNFQFTRLYKYKKKLEKQSDMMTLVKTPGIKGSRQVGT